MCDTMVVLNQGRVLFAKNSDRDANEGQNIEWHPRRKTADDGTLRCTHISIPDVVETNAIMISSSFWNWGGEIGTNEHGVTIGNETVFTKNAKEKHDGLIGVDLLRLALERSNDAKGACEVITGLLEEYGQGGRCGLEDPNYTYDNSFLVADVKSAFVLETAGRTWAMEEVKGRRSISNGLTIPEFRKAHSDYVYTRFSGSRERLCRTQEMCSSCDSVADLMAALRDHGVDGAHPQYGIINGGLNVPCVHGGGLIASSQCTSSWVSELTDTSQQHWVTATSAPCTGIFKPVQVNRPVDYGPQATDTANDSLWWRHERFQRKVMRDPEAAMPLFLPERAEVEARWIANPPDSADAFDEASQLLEKWTKAVQALPNRDVRPWWTRRYWNKRNAMARMESF